MKKMVAVLAVIFICALTAQAGNVSKADEFIKAGMLPQAVALLEEEIYGKDNPNPTNAEAHFKLASCYVELRRYIEADERFASAVKLKPSYGYKIAEVWKKNGYKAVERADIDGATALFNRAAYYQETLRSEIAADLVSRAKSFVAQKNYGKAHLHMTVAINLDISHMKEGCDIFTVLGDNADDKLCLFFYAQSATFCSGNEKTGNRLLALAKDMAKKPGKEADVEKYKNTASQFLSKNSVEKSIPDAVVYAPGEYTFSLKAGEQTDHWIVFPEGRATDSDVTSHDNKFKLVFSDGDVVSGDAKSAPRKLYPKFKIVAVADQPTITMVVK